MQHLDRPRPMRRRAGPAVAGIAGFAVVAASVGFLVLPGVAQTDRPAAPLPPAAPPPSVYFANPAGGAATPQRIEPPAVQAAPPAAGPAVAEPPPPPASTPAVAAPEPAAPVATPQTGPAAETVARPQPPMPVPRPQGAPRGVTPEPAEAAPPPASPDTVAAAPARPVGRVLRPEAETGEPAAGGCLGFEAFAASDRDGDVARNAASLRAPGLCLEVERFTEGRLNWTLQIISHRPARPGPLWAVPHDNEHAAFDTAVAAMLRHGGVIVAVETGGNRFNGPQDPNRNFNEGGARCPQQVGPSAEYTRRFLGRRGAGQPIIALHTNDPGVGGGNGTISIAAPTAGSIPFRRVAAAGAPTGSASDDTLVFVASTRRPDQDANLAAIVSTLRARGLNVMYEVVTAARNDCSMSNWAALRGIGDYFNVEVVHGQSGTQRALVDIVMRVLGGDRAIAPPPEPVTPAAAVPRGTRPAVPAAPAGPSAEDEPRP